MSFIISAWQLNRNDNYTVALRYLISAVDIFPQCICICDCDFISPIFTLTLLKSAFIAPSSVFVPLLFSPHDPPSLHMYPPLSFSTAFLCLCSLLHFPDGDLAIAACRATQDVAILGRAERLDAVWVSVQLLRHSVALGVHHQHLTPHLTVALISGCVLATAAHPDLRQGGGGGFEEK